MSVTTWYLEMTDPAELRPASARESDWKLNQAPIPSPELNRESVCCSGGRLELGGPS